MICCPSRLWWMKYPCHSCKQPHSQATNSSTDWNLTTTSHDTNWIAYWAKTGLLSTGLWESEENMASPLALHALHALRPKSSAASQNTPTDKKENNSIYASALYKVWLARKKSFMHNSDKGITAESAELCQTLLHNEQTLPDNTVFAVDVFEKACRELQGRKNYSTLVAC